MRKRILIAEDNPEVQEAIRRTLEGKYEIVGIVSTPEDAINYNKPFDLLLTDFTFKDKYGRKMKKQGLDIIEFWKGKNKGLKAILMSSGLHNGMVNACNEMGAGTFKKYEDDITPINNKGLNKTIEEYI